MSEPILVATDLIKKYRLPNKTVEVLNGASLTITPGERVAIVGRSGIGKSTLLHVLGALDRPESGEVIINGRSIYKLSERARSNLRAREIGFIFQSYHLFPEMDISENVMLPAKTAPTSKHAPQNYWNWSA
jgi:ABC-type lipoprotein export system ATPase subunit